MRYAAFLLLALTTASPAQETSPNRDYRLPIPDHVVIVIEDNKSFSDVIGSADAPYLNSLAMSGALLTEYYGLHHPSQPNYIELFAGANLNVSESAGLYGEAVWNSSTPKAEFFDPSVGEVVRDGPRGVRGT